MASTTRPEPQGAEPDETPAGGSPEPTAGPDPAAPEPDAPAPTKPATTKPETGGPATAEPAADQPSPAAARPTAPEPGDLTELDADLRPGSLAAPPPWPALLGAEAFGTFVLVLAGVGTALYSGVGNLTGGPLAVALAFGLALAAGVAAFGHVSGAHFNPAVTLGAALAGRFDWARVLPYVVAQIVGGFLAALVLFVTVPSKLPAAISGDPDSDVRQFFSGTANGFDRAVNLTTLDGAHSPLGRASSGQVTVSLLTALIIEAVVTAAFVGVILAVTRRRANGAAAPLAIGGMLAVGLLVTMPLTNGSLNPARSTAVVLFSDTWAAAQLWVFWVAPLFGAVIAGLAARIFTPPLLDAADDADDETARTPA